MIEMMIFEHGNWLTLCCYVLVWFKALDSIEIELQKNMATERARLKRESDVEFKPFADNFINMTKLAIREQVIISGLRAGATQSEITGKGNILLRGIYEFNWCD